tara:strand:+ start:4895 stop:5677 length:783 start_codon:yes stop_codon:yes gene_type:complete
MYKSKPKYIIENYKKYFMFKDDFELFNSNITKNYEFFLFYFYKYSNKSIRNHRKYFSKYKRGYGESSFSSMWEYLFSNYRPKNILEIGVYRGQTLSLFHILSNLYDISSNIYGITPLSSSGDEVSSYIDIDYLEDINKNFKFFNLPEPNIINEYSNSDRAINFINSKKWDLIYIDGSHDFEDVNNDFNECLSNLNINGLIVIDDSSLYLDYDAKYIEKNYKLKTFKGHPGPSKVVLDIISMNKIKYLFGVGHNNVFLKKS